MAVAVLFDSAGTGAVSSVLVGMKLLSSISLRMIGIMFLTGFRESGFCRKGLLRMSYL